jgi:hypothetical protein
MKIKHPKKHNDAGPRASKKRPARWGSPGKPRRAGGLPKAHRAFLAVHVHLPRGAAGPKASPLDFLPLGSL